MTHLRIGLHALDRTGPPMLALAYLDWLAEAHRGIGVDIVAFRGGDLRARFERHGPVEVLLEPSEPWDAGAPDPRRAADIGRRTECLPDATVTLLVSVAAGQCLPFFSAPGPIVTWCVEQGEDLHWLHQPVGLAARTTSWLAGTAAVASEVEAALPGCNPVVVPEFVADPPSEDEVRSARVRVRSELGLDTDHLLVVGAGIATHRKAPDLFLEVAVARLRAGHEGERYRWIGGEHDPLFDPVRREIDRLGLGSGVDIVPSVADLGPSLAAADVLLHPARLDAFPLVCLHAAAVGRPVVAFRGVGAVGGVEAMFGSSFVGTEYPDVAGLAACVGDLADPHRRSELGAAQREHVIARWTASVAAPRLHASVVAAAEAVRP